jgi:hypothetical protein
LIFLNCGFQFGSPFGVLGSLPFDGIAPSGLLS